MGNNDLKFAIGFDLKEGVDAALREGDLFLRRLDAEFARRAIKVRFELNTQKFGAIEEVRRRLAQLKIEPITPETKSAIRELTQELQQLAKALEAVQKYSARVGSTTEAVRNSKIALNEQRAAAAHELARQRAARAAMAEEKLAQARVRSTSAINMQTRAYAAQHETLGRLTHILGTYASFRMVGSFLSQIRETTAEFELQRVSLGAIIQDQQRANQLFSELKSFALQSPLKILDLTKYTKQVAAYGIETEKLFDTTKRLADVSVGLGVDMGRLVLAYGQVKAASYLRAAEIRQFTEAEIPMLDLLAKKFTDLQGKMVSTEQVMDLVSKRAVSFSMVEDIFNDMTSAGGMFYNMQEKQAQTLFGMWSKLGDAAAIMYNEIGNTGWVNAGMKTTIGLLESMMRNWKTSAKVLSTAGVSLAVYVAGLKNAAIASKALSLAEATTLATQKARIINTPKLAMAILGHNRAITATILLEQAYTKAAIKANTATNLFTKGFWKLTAALLANPFVAVAAAIAGVVAAIIHFRDNAETAAERAEQLNKSVSSMKNLKGTTQPLIDTYNDLIKKTERTTEEQKKLSAVTHELAKQYPGAVKAVGNFGEEIELATDKLNQLYLAEKEARMENTRHELEKTEQKITETEEKIAKLQKSLQEGTKTEVSVNRRTGYVQTSTVQMSDEDKGKILRQIDELLYGEDGQSGLNLLKESAQATREALEAMTKGITVEELRIEKFGAWKKKLTEFKKEVGGIKVNLFDDSTIAQFGTLEEALDAAAKKYKEATESVEKYNKTLEQGVAGLGQEQFDKIAAERDEAQAMKELSEEALNYYNAMALLLKVMRGGRTSDPRLQNLKEEISLTKKLYDEYQKLEKQIGTTKAAEKIQEIYSNTIKTLQDRAKKYGFEFELLFTDKNLKANMQHFIDKMKELQKEVDKKGKPKFPNIGKEIDEAVAQLGDVDFNSLQKALEKKLKELADRISRTKTAKEFYEKILSQTGDYDLVTKVSLSIYGENGDELKAQLAKQIKEMTGGYVVEVPVSIISADNRIDNLALERFVKSKQKELGGIESNTYKELVKIAQDGQKDLAKTYEGYLKDLEKAKTYSDKRIELARYTANQIAEIEKSTLPKDEKERLTAGYREREDKEAAKLEYEAFKDTPLYIQMFEDLGQASSYALNSMKEKLIGLQNVWGSALDPTQLKEIQNRINEIDAQLRVRNPFKTLRESYQQYHDALKNYTVLGAEGNVASAQASYDKAVKDTGSADSKEAKAAERTLEIEKQKLEIAKQLTDEKGKALKGQKSLNEAARIANENEAQARVELAAATAAEERAKAEGGDVEAAHEAVEAAKEKLNLAQATSEIIQNEAKTSKTLKESWLAAGQTIGNIGAGIKEVGQSISAMMEAFGSEAEDIQFVDDISNAVGDIFAGVGDIIQSALSGDVVGIVTGAITAPLKIITGFANLFSAGKVRRANKEIKKQQKVLDQLEYTYGRLEKAADKVFGSDYISNYNQRLQNLQAQQAAYEKQAQAERSKGKKEDKQKTEEYLKKLGRQQMRSPKCSLNCGTISWELILQVRHETLQVRG